MRRCLLLALLWNGCTPEPETPPNVLLVSIDTLRADALGCYGSPRETSPSIDALAARSTLYRKASSPTSWTLPAHVSMLTGRHHVEVGVTRSDEVIPEDATLLAECLQRAGYRTAAFVDSPPKGYVGGKRGFSRGFDEYRHAERRRGQLRKYDMAVTADAAIEWLEEREAEQPFFLFLHTKSVHTVGRQAKLPDDRQFPYLLPDPFLFRFAREGVTTGWSDDQLGTGVSYFLALNEEYRAGNRNPANFPADEREYLRLLYDAGVAYVDTHLGRVFDKLTELGHASDTVIIVTSDHGEAFLEHNQFFHVELFDEIVRVPLIVHHPSRDGGRVVQQEVALQDIMPTILDWTGTPIPDAVRGRVLPADDGEAPPVFFQTLSDFGYKSVGLRDGRWKLVAHNFADPDALEYLLFDTEADPGETTPIANPAQLAAMRRQLEQWLGEKWRNETVRMGLDQETLDHLRALGYR